MLANADGPCPPRSIAPLGRLLSLEDLRPSGPPPRRVAVRVIDYEVEDPGRAGNDTPYRLLTTILDDEAAPAGELAACYAER